jgi:DNA-binding transcriptional LysR family regulator
VDKLSSIETFITVADCQSFSGAAEQLRMSKAMVSKHIQHLEQALGTRLFARTTRHLRLTEAGAAYLAGCRRLLADLAALEHAVGQFSDAPHGVLKVLAPTSFGSFQLAPVIAEYAQRYPSVQVQLNLSDRPVGLMEEGVDVEIHIGALPDSSLVARRIAEVQLLVCGAPAYFARHGVPQTPADLAQHNCLRYSQGSRKGSWLFRVDGRDVATRVHGDFEATTGDAVRMAAVGGLGLAQLPSYMVRDDLAAGRLGAVLVAWAPTPAPLYAVYAHRDLSATVREFVELLAAHFHHEPGRD